MDIQYKHRPWRKRRHRRIQQSLLPVHQLRNSNHYIIQRNGKTAALCREERTFRNIEIQKLAQSKALNIRALQLINESIHRTQVPGSAGLRSGRTNVRYDRSAQISLEISVQTRHSFFLIRVFFLFYHGDLFPPFLVKIIVDSVCFLFLCGGVIKCTLSERESCSPLLEGPAGSDGVFETFLLQYPFISVCPMTRHTVGIALVCLEWLSLVLAGTEVLRPRGVPLIS